MAKEKKKENVSEEQIPKESFDANKIDFDSLDDAGKKDAFEKVKLQNGLLISLVKDFTNQVEELEKKAEGKMSDENYKRLAADFENYKRRNNTAVSTAYADGKIDVIKNCLAVLDNIDRAIDNMVDENDKKGVLLIRKQFEEFMKKYDVVEIEALNMPFDPNFHNAVMQGEAERAEDVDKITEVFQKGYKMGDKVIRYSFVKVAK